MPKAIRYTLLSARDLLISAGPFAALAIALLVLAYLWLDPAPPKRVRLATGPAQSAYDEFGKRYQAELARNGIEVVLVPSNGSTANERLLRAGEADLAFVQGGTVGRRRPGPAAPEEEAELLSLGSLFLARVWLFDREDAARRKAPDGTLRSLTDLAGLCLLITSLDVSYAVCRSRRSPYH